MTAGSSRKIGGILLAAGGSTRFGSPKQLYNFEGKTLIRRAAETIRSSECSPIVIVLGSETAISTAELDGLNVLIAVNEEWRSGMSSSIHTGLERLLQIEPQLDAVLITLVDQPLVNPSDLSALISAFTQNDLEIAASHYNDTLGVPAVFSSTLFERLLRLKGDKGAKGLLYSRPDTIRVDMPNAAFDIDIPEQGDELMTSKP